MGPRSIFALKKVLTRIGEPSQFLAFIESGELSVYDRNGAAIAKLGPGDLFGELGYLLNRPRVADLTAITSGRFLRIPYDRLDAWIEQNPVLGKAFYQWLSHRLALRLSAQAHDTRKYVALVAHDKMKAKLCEFANQNREALTHFDLAATATTARHLF